MIMYSSERMRVLDGLRAIGVLLITVFFHYCHFTNGDVSLNPLIRLFPFACKYGFLAVELFLIISGMTFMTFYYERVNQKDISVKDFTLNRIARIYPIYILSQVIMSILLLIRKDQGLDSFITSNNSITSFLDSIFLIQSWGINESGGSFNQPAWTLSVEILCYIIFFIVSRNSHKPIVWSILFILVGIYGNNHGMSDLVCRGFIAFFIGMIIAKIYPIITEYLEEKNNMQKYLNIFLTIWIIAVICFIRKTGSTFFAESIVEFGRGISLILWLPLIFIAINSKLFKYLLSVKYLQIIGKISFTMYIIHFPLQTLIHTVDSIYFMGINFRSTSAWSGYCLILFGLSIIIHDYVEEPLKKYIKEFPNKR